MAVSAVNEARAATHLRATGRLRRVAIVADSLLLAEAITLGFRKSGEFKLVVYAHGVETSPERLLGTNPDVILLDDMDRSHRALELTRRLVDRNQQVAIIMLTGEMDPEWVRELLDAGASGVISKATHPFALATLVREALDGHICLMPKPLRAETEPGPSKAPDGLPLTMREIEILRLVASGSTNGDVARRLWVTEQTVKFHLRNIYRKLDVANRTQASRVAYLNGLIDEGPAYRFGPEAALTAAS